MISSNLYESRNEVFVSGNWSLTTSFNDKEADLIEEIKRLFHDLRSPLAALKMFAYSLEGSADKDFVNNRTQRMSRTIDAFADKILKKNNSLAKFDLININGAIEAMLLEKTTEYKDLNTQFVYEPVNLDKTLTLNGSRDEFERMLSNLINNAVEACDKDGVVKIGLKQKGNICILDVTDNGKGMSNATLQKLRAGVATSFGKVSGQGIGFQQIREAVLNLNGKLQIKSKLGVGSSILIEFTYS